jgi:purine-binding chemotaxis protein CheW
MTEAETVSRIVSIRLGGKLYGLPLESVREVVRMVAITPLPDSPPELLGALNVRGTIMPVYDLRHLLKMPPLDPGLTTPLIITWANGRWVALMVDEVAGVLSVSAEDRVESHQLTPELEAAVKNNGLSVGSVIKVRDALLVLCLNPDAVLRSMKGVYAALGEGAHQEDE